MPTMVLRASYYWLTIHNNWIEYVKKCMKCQEHILFLYKLEMCILLYVNWVILFVYFFLGLD